MPLPMSYSARSVWARRTTTLSAAAGIALVVFVMAAAGMLASGMRRTLLRAGRDDRALVMQHDAYSEGPSRIRQGLLEHAASAPGVRRDPSGQPLVSGESLLPIRVPRLNDPSRISNVQVRGVTASAYAVRPEVHVIEGRAPRLGQDEAMIGKGLVGQYPDLALGGHLTLRKQRRVAIVGVFDADDSAYESEIWTGLDVVRSSMGWEGYLSSITAALDDRSALAGFGAALAADKSIGVDVVSERAYYEKVSEGLARSVTALGDLVTLIFACGAMLGAAITMNEAIARRRREIGVLRALGFSAPEVLVAFVLESAAVALGGALLGVGLAALLTLARFSITNYGTGNELAFPFTPEGTILLRALCAGALLGVLGGFFPALKAARTDPVRAMRV